MEGTRLYMLLLEAGGPSALRRACYPKPTPTALQASSPQEGGGSPRPEARGVGPRAEPGQGSETRCLPPSTIFVCSIKGGGSGKRGESCEGEGTVTGWSGEGDQERDSWRSCWTDMQRPTHRDREKLRDREAGGVRRGGGGGVRPERDCER